MTDEEYELVVSGRLALPDGRLLVGELGIRDGRIAAIAEGARLRGAERLDAGEQLVLPGLVDTHVHTRSEPAEGITSATAAAAAGGVTTIIDMPYDAVGPVVTADVLERKLADLEREAIVDVALYGTIRKSGGLDEIPGLVEAGACAFKVSLFETHPVRFPRIDDGELLLAMRRIAEADSLIAFHAENDEIVRRLTRELEAEGRTDPLVHADGRPPLTETEAIGRALELGLATGVRMHIVHASVERSFTLVERARGDGVDVTAETCTHYLILDQDDLVRQGSRAKINPPLRPRREVEALWRLLAEGRVDWVTSDHVGWEVAQKAGDIYTAKSGAPSLQLTLALLHDEGVVRRGLPLARLLEVLAERPARRFGLWPQKGSLTVGADADIVLFDPEARWRVEESSLVGSAGWSPYNGRDLVGRVQTVLVRGRTVFADGAVVGRPGQGTFVRPQPT